MALTEERVRRVLDVALRLGETLLARQAGSADVADSVLAVAAAYGVPEAQVNITADAITLSVPRGVPGAPVTAMWLVTSRSPDYTRLYEATRLAQCIVAEKPPLDEVESQLVELSRGGHRYPRWVSTVSLAVMAASMSLLLGAGALVVMLAGLTTALIDRVGRVLNTHRVPLLFQQVVGAALATGVTVCLDAAGRLPAGQAPSLVVAASIAVLLSGLATVGTVQDAITGYLLTATSRGVEILLSSIGVLVGVTIAVRFGVLAGVDVRVTPNLPVPLLSLPTRVIAGTLGAGAAAVANYAPARAALAAGAAGAAGSLLYLVASMFGASTVAASFAAALGIGLAGALCARSLRVPPLVIVMAGIFPLVPGLSLYRGFVDLSTGLYTPGVASLVTASGIALALGGGVVLGPLLAPTLRRELGHLRSRRTARGHRWRHGHAHRLPALAGVETSPAGGDPGTGTGQAVQG
ncbi:threonine/serine exporter family protein [Streptomyces sp. ICBB 8177]|uniref:threonine/serine ThrE exporter family protein n=1 Tax=Streptomyces sp. ICBB 8177 TaxID=563922 RepID=UPI0018EE4D46|nr:threonine/serine exporter family protein [Streptomyces sp. ICBB 8177]